LAGLCLFEAPDPLLPLSASSSSGLFLAGSGSEGRSGLEVGGCLGLWDWLLDGVVDFGEKKLVREACFFFPDAGVVILAGRRYVVFCLEFGRIKEVDLHRGLGK